MFSCITFKFILRINFIYLNCLWICLSCWLATRWSMNLLTWNTRFTCLCYKTLYSWLYDAAVLALPCVFACFYLCIFPFWSDINIPNSSSEVDPKLDMYGIINVLYLKADKDMNGMISEPELADVYHGFDSNGKFFHSYHGIVISGSSYKVTCNFCSYMYMVSFYFGNIPNCSAIFAEK